ncbi:MAG TPA: TOBE domain-containing protein [Burkholderiales bacterium]|nr:TOBE domain-containing protein [Burkholderiales bacterium]
MANGLKGRLMLEKDGMSFLGGKRVELLEAIDLHGSISSAAKAVGMSYKGAWDTVDAMNNQSDQPLVTRVTGGRHGGGTQLTEHGRRIVRLFRAGESEYQKILEALIGGMEGFDAFQDLLRRFSMRTSARNQFLGRIVRLSKGPVSVDVRIKLDERNEIGSVVTRESADVLGLEVGMEVYALVKAPAVILTTDTMARFSAENRLCGHVSRIHLGEVNAEVMLVLDNEKTVTSVVTHETIEKLGLTEGMPACALFAAASVILAMLQ